MTSGALTFFKVVFLPDANLLAWVFIAMLIDFTTGVAKAFALGQARTSSGYRKTVTKFTQYAGAIAAGIILANTLPKDNSIVAFVNNGVLILLIYIEVTSVFENLYAIDSSSVFSKYFIAPVLKVLTIAIKKNPLNRLHGEEK